VPSPFVSTWSEEGTPDPAASRRRLVSPLEPSLSSRSSSSSSRSPSSGGRSSLGAPSPSRARLRVVGRRRRRWSCPPESGARRRTRNPPKRVSGRRRAPSCRGFSRSRPRTRRSRGTRRFPSGSCPRCRAESVIRYGNYREFQVYLCTDCGRTLNDKTGTVFEYSTVPLRKWYLAVYTYIRRTCLAPIDFVSLS
jgi:hypothetical protein